MTEKILIPSLPDTMSIEIAKHAIGESKSLLRILQEFEKLELLYKNSNPKPSTEFMTKNIWQFIFKTLGLQMPDPLPPSNISFFNGMFEFMFSALRSSAGYWRYYVVEQRKDNNTVELLNVRRDIVKTIPGNHWRSTDNYLLVVHASGDRSTVITAFASRKAGVITEAEGIITFDDKAVLLDVAETVIGLIISVRVSGKTNVYNLKNSQIVVIPYKTDIRLSRFTGLGYTGYYSNDRLISYLDQHSAQVKVEWNGKPIIGGSGTTNAKFRGGVVIKSTNALGIDLLKLSLFSGGGGNYYCKTTNDVSDVLWTTMKNYQLGMDSFLVDSTKVVDLYSGMTVLDLYSLADDPEKTLINGFTRKEDDSGYYIWLNEENTGYSLKKNVLQYLRSKGIDTKRLIDEPLYLPELWMDDKISLTPAENVHSYYNKAREFISEYTIDDPLPVYSMYSLYPYYHRRMTGQNVLVIALTKDYVTVLGYSLAGHRVHRRYNIGELSTMKQKYGRSLLYIDLSDIGLISVIYTWMTLFLSSLEYIKANRDTKIDMIDTDT